MTEPENDFSLADQLPVAALMAAGLEILNEVMILIGAEKEAAVDEQDERTAMALADIRLAAQKCRWIAAAMIAYAHKRNAKATAASVHQVIAPRGHLTAREMEIIAALLNPALADSQQIAASLRMSWRTLRIHLSLMRRKLGLPKRLELPSSSLLSVGLWVIANAGELEMEAPTPEQLSQMAIGKEMRELMHGTNEKQIICPQTRGPMVGALVKDQGTGAIYRMPAETSEASDLLDRIATNAERMVDAQSGLREECFAAILNEVRRLRELI